MSTLYPHTCVVTRPGTYSGAYDTESGQPSGTAVSDVTVYSGSCRFTHHRTAVVRAEGGDVSVAGVPLVQVPRQAAVFSADTDEITVTGNGVSFSGKVREIDYQGAKINLFVESLTVTS